jgi:hypothetical protein
MREKNALVPSLQVEKQIPPLAPSIRARLVKRPLHRSMKNQFLSSLVIKAWGDDDDERENKVQHKRTKINDSSSEASV